MSLSNACWTRAVSPLEKDQRIGMSAARINAIGKAFNHASDN